ncbi:unnamed protein product [Acanthoscelides obtectus]|uniref:Uncharacterized protein n=1 Tax=Acanthoscelides obtectus TaxID=200917 RepID=A0A9P0LVS6_ACAOB|nr:unnamed protein product [Acanthoscelides obtectus]CAK1665391.1 hypothetical protein AOBTE_LOCUS24788 [Acanthoscelides obtectus]
MMRWPTFQWILAFVAVLMIQDMVKAAPNPRGEDMLKELLKLDKMYSSIARPRFGKRTQGNADFQQADYDSQYQSDPEMSDWMAVRR